MKPSILVLLLCGCTAAIVCNSETWGNHLDKWKPRNFRNQDDLETVEWQYDGIRAHFKRLEKQRADADEFSRTNTNPRMAAVVEGNNIDWRPEKGSKELGYRSDGVVVWRDLPEGK